jgi:Domain of unknown function (DUF6456)
MTGEKRSQDRDSASTVRILRFLQNAGGEAKLAPVDGASVRIDSRESSLVVSRDVIAEICRQALVELRKSGCRLTSLGRESLKDLLTSRNDLTRSSKYGRGKRGRRTSESPLDRLYQRGGKSGKAWLSEAEFEAGERLRHDFECGRLQPRITASWDASPVCVRGHRVSGAMELSDFALDARLRVEKAIGTLQEGLAGIALDVCCFLKGLEQVERERQWPPRSAKVMLKTALAGLAEHYGLTKTSHRKFGSILHWGDDDYRPDITPPTDAT